MGALTATVLLLGVSATLVQSISVQLLSRPGLRASLEDSSNGGLNLVVQRNGQSEQIAVIGRRTDTIMNVVRSGDVELAFSNNTTLTMKTEELTGDVSGTIITVTWEAPAAVRLEDCADFGYKQWYGGPQQKRQYWPIQKLNLAEYSYVTKEADNCGVAERYWLNSEGIFYYFDKSVPLFITQNDLEANSICFIAEVKAPYSSSKRETNDLVYTVGIFDNPRIAHEYAVENFLGKPTDIPDERMFELPIWSTWARYKSAIDEDVVQVFADEVNNNGFLNSQFEIDDLWETCYGSMTVDETKFPNMSNTVEVLKEKGFRVTIWAHPFLNKGCEPWYTDAKDAGYLVTSESGVVESSWWNDNGTTTSYIDFTKPAARLWYSNRVLALKNSYGIDSFKFDAGETSWSPQIPVLEGDDLKDQPGVITSDYLRQVSMFGPMVEVRSGYRTQDLPIFIRIIDKDSVWTFENGLPTLITTLLQMNMNGYGLVLPDMIGGNGYQGAPSKELFIRWLQANTLMPSLQFSYVPWDYDSETIEISKTFVDLHAQFTPHILAACRKHVDMGAPVNPPIWWIAPNDTTAHAVWDEFLLGDSILAAPVVMEGATTRDIYLPRGTWLEQNDTTKVHEGPIWLLNYEAPLTKLPYFVKVGEGEEEPDTSSSNSLCMSVVLVIAAVFVIFN